MLCPSIVTLLSWQECQEIRAQLEVKEKQAAPSSGQLRTNSTASTMCASLVPARHDLRWL